jgi:hypothetical protein
MKRRNLTALSVAIDAARTRRERALGFYNLALFHDNNSRERQAIPNYQSALRLGLNGEVRAQAYAWLASSFYKTGQRHSALRALSAARLATREGALRKFLDGLERRITRV